MNTSVQWVGMGLMICSLCARAFAGGSGLNVVVVVNQNSPDSVELGNYYCEKRGVPPQNLLRVNWGGGNVNWTRTEFESTLRTPLIAMLAARALTNQIDYILLSMGFPYRVTESTGATATSGINSTTSALYYGFKVDGECAFCPACCPGCSLPFDSGSAYAGSENIFRLVTPSINNSWMVMMLTSSNLSLAKALVDRGVASDTSFPTQTVYLAKSYDPNRNIRYLAFNDAIFDARVRGNYSILATNLSSSEGLTGLLGFQNGIQIHTVTPNTFIPGALADNLTSYGGAIFENSEHTDALDYIIAGATASYGTVVEPCAHPEKFASPRNYFYQARGFSAAECYFQSVTNPYQGILVGEPLAAPFALPANGAWTSPAEGVVLAGTHNLSLQFTSAGADRPIQQVDLFVDGLFARTITNLPPRTSNIVYVTLNGVQTNYTIPANATLKSVASNLTVRLNQTAFSNATQVRAFSRGDRIELQGLNINKSGADIALNVSNYIGTASLLTTRLVASRSNLLDTAAHGFRRFTIQGQLVINDYLQLAVTRTNGVVTLVGVTNQTPSTGNDIADIQNFAQSLVNAVNSHAALIGADGVVAEDLIAGQIGSNPAAEFNLRARSAGWKEAQIQVQLTGTFTINPAATGRLDDNLSDLRPRNHIYVTAGLTNLALTFPFNTSTIADGYHDITAVAYEGSHVRTQRRISQTVRIQNNPWSATFTALVGGTNTALEATLQFVVNANTTGITNIQLFSTGGALATSNNVSSATFSVAATSLGIGLHPFYALISGSDGTQYRTETKWFRIIGAEPPFQVSIAGLPPTLTWPATAGRAYQVLSATQATDIFAPRAAVTPTNSTGLWTETNTSSPQRFYRVKTP